MTSASSLYVGVAWPIIVFLSSLLLHIILPSHPTVGYARDQDGSPLSYRLNGLRVLTFAFSISLSLPAGWLASFYESYWISLGACFALGIVLSAVAMWFGCVGVCAPKRSGRLNARDAVSRLENFFFGYELNPRLFGVDVKMFLYLYGAVLLSLLLLSGLTRHCILFMREGEIGRERAAAWVIGSASPAVLTYCGMMVRDQKSRNVNKIKRERGE